MVNEKLLFTKDDFNGFTNALRELIALKGAITCTLRNKRVVNVLYYGANSNDVDSAFHSFDWDHVWNNDGSSVTNTTFDIIHFNS